MLWLWRTEGRRRVAVDDGGRSSCGYEALRVGGSSWPFYIETGMYTEVASGCG